MNSIYKTIIYIKASIKAIIYYPSWVTVRSIIKYFSKWRKYLAAGRNSVVDSMPWLTFGAIDFIKRIIRPSMSIFEYGSGGSTLFWSNHVAKVVSVEHEASWFTKMQEVFANRKINNVDYVLAEAEQSESVSNKEVSNPNDYVSSDPLFEGRSFERYVKQIDRFDDATFDVIVVDGRARPSCILHSLNKLKKGGYLIVDNSERKYYLSSFTFDKSEWRMWRFYGPVPYIYHFSETTIFQKK